MQRDLRAFLWDARESALQIECFVAAWLCEHERQYSPDCRATALARL